MIGLNIFALLMIAIAYNQGGPTRVGVLAMALAGVAMLISTAYSIWKATK